MADIIINIGFNEAVIMDRDYYFNEIDKNLVSNTLSNFANNIEAMISSFSTQQFLGFCCLAQNRILEMT